MKLVWISDLHLEFVDAVPLRAFLEGIESAHPDAILLTGDISNARRLEQHLTMLAESLNCPVYFVLGNHDFYLGDFAGVESLVMKVCALHTNLIELGHGEIIPLGTDTVLIGHRGWADGRAGSGRSSRIRLNDHRHIADLRLPFSAQLFSKLNRLGDESAEYISRVAPQAFLKANRLIIATHVPPFAEAALYEGKPSDAAHAPHFTNVAMGRAILQIAQSHPDKMINVLSGHTHHQAFYSPLPNLQVEVAGAEYNRPRISSILTI